MDEKKARSQFTFYDSFYRAVSRIKKKTDRADAYEVLCQYALEGTEPDLEKLPDAVAVVFEMCKPNLVASRRRAESGRKGGAAKQTEATAKQTQANAKQTEANAKQNGEPLKQVKEKEQDKEKDKDKDKEQLLGECAHTTVFNSSLNVFNQRTPGNQVSAMFRHIPNASLHKFCSCQLGALTENLHLIGCLLLLR